jgi:hypothetical protein
MPLLSAGEQACGLKCNSYEFHAQMARKKFGPSFLLPMYPERYLFLKGNLTDGRTTDLSFYGRTCCMPTDRFNLPYNIHTVGFVWRFGDVQHIAEHSQPLLIGVWQFLSSGQDHCHASILYERVLRQVMFRAVDRHVTSNLPQTASLVLLRTLERCTVRICTVASYILTRFVGFPRSLQPNAG